MHNTLKCTKIQHWVEHCKEIHNEGGLMWMLQETKTYLGLRTNRPLYYLFIIFSMTLTFR